MAIDKNSSNTQLMIAVRQCLLEEFEKRATEYNIKDLIVKHVSFTAENECYDMIRFKYGQKTYLALCCMKNQIPMLLVEAVPSIWMGDMINYRSKIYHLHMDVADQSFAEKAVANLMRRLSMK